MGQQLNDDFASHIYPDLRETALTMYWSRTSRLLKQGETCSDETRILAATV